MNILIQDIKKDLYRYYPQKSTIFILIKALVQSKGFSYMFYKRIFNYFPKSNLIHFVAYLMLKYLTRKYGFQIGGKIGSGFYIGHFGTIIVSVNSVIGINCNISPGVTIGRDHRGKRRGSPTLGDYVWIGTNAVVVGKIFIGDNVLIAPNAFVNFDIPSNSIVVGNPAKIIPRYNATKGYINNILDK